MEGRTSGMAIVNFAWIRACVKAGLPDELPSSAKMEAKENNGNCMLNALLEDMICLSSEWVWYQLIPDLAGQLLLLFVL